MMRRYPKFVDILWTYPKTEYNLKAWRSRIPQSLVSLDTLPYDAVTNDLLLYEVNRPGNICALLGG